jgi:hypothetical protein
MLKRALTIAAMVALATGTSFAALTFFQEFKNTDMQSFGVGGMRGVGSGTMTVAGVFGPITAAYLYWDDITTSTDPTAGASVFVDGNPVTGTSIGFADDNCWGYDNSQAYRADVTSLVQAKGNGAYALTGFGAGVPVNADGASLIIFYDDGNGHNNVDVRLYDGNDSNEPSIYDPADWDVAMGGIIFAGGKVTIGLHVADGQDDGTVAYFDEALIINGVTIAPTGSIFSGTSVPGPSYLRGNLWDIRNFDITALMVPGPNSLLMTLSSPVTAFDCLGLVAATVSVTATTLCPGIQLDNLIVGPPENDPFDAQLKRVYRPGTLNIDDVTVANVLMANGVDIQDPNLAVQAACAEKDTPLYKCTAFVSGPGSGLNTNFKTGLKKATDADLSKSVLKIALGIPQNQVGLGERALLFSPPCTTYSLCVVYAIIQPNGLPGIPQTVDIHWVVSEPTRESIRRNIDYFSTVAAGATQKPKITSDVVAALNAALDIPDPLTALTAFEGVVADASITFADLLAKGDVRFFNTLLIDDDEEPIGCLLDEQAAALLWH